MLEMAFVSEANSSKIKGIKVPIIGMTRETEPIFKALNIKYAPRVQNRVESEARLKTAKAGTWVKGKTRSIKRESKLI